MAAVLAVILVAVLVAMPPGLPSGRKGAKFSEVFSKSPNVNWLSAARVLLFGARDVWFVVGIPIYFYAVLSDGTVEGNRAAFFMIGTFMALWIILYGAVQAGCAAPSEGRVETGGGACGRRAGLGAGAGDRAALLTRRGWVSWRTRPGLTATLVAGLLVFGAPLRGQLLAAFLPDPRLHPR
jgi:hypothetical protein